MKCKLEDLSKYILWCFFLLLKVQDGFDGFSEKSEGYFEDFLKNSEEGLQFLSNVLYILIWL